MTSPQDFDALVGRLEKMEADLKKARAEIRALRDTRFRRLWRSVVLGVCGAAVASLPIAGLRAQDGIHQVRGPFVVMDSNNRPLVSVTDCSKDYQFDPEKQAVGETPGPCVRGLKVYDSDGADVISATSHTGGELSVTRGHHDGTGVFITAGSIGEGMQVVDKSKQIIFDVDSDQATIGASKGLTVLSSLSVRDKTMTGVKVSALGMRGVTVYNGQGNVASQVTVDGRGGWIGVRDGKTKMGKASYIADDKGGGVFVAGEEGDEVAGLYANKKGTVLALSDNAGKVTGEINSYDGLQFYNASGQLVAKINATGSGSSGEIWLGNASGQGIVEAGMLGDGRGVVRAGPLMGGPPGGLGLPTTIMGVIK